MLLEVYGAGIVVFSRRRPEQAAACRLIVELGLRLS
jgi:hypothetical protein